jgi:hypothetical protein
MFLLRSHTHENSSPLHPLHWLEKHYPHQASGMSRAVIHQQLEALQVYTGGKKKRRSRQSAATKRLHDRITSSSGRGQSHKKSSTSASSSASDNVDIGSWSSDDEDDDESSSDEPPHTAEEGEEEEEEEEGEGACDRHGEKKERMRALPYALENRRVRDFKRRERYRDRTRRNVRTLSQLDRITKPSRKASQAMSQVGMSFVCIGGMLE